MKFIFSFLTAILFLTFSTKLVSAVNAPNFPTCSNPQGTLIVSYDSGTHGVAGGNSYTGNDKVYKINENSLVQCLCTTDGKGIQTNWWKATSLDETQVNKLKSEGWIYIPTGSVWGLDQDAYMARNINYSCTSDGGTGGGTSGGSVVNSVGQVLGLAFTGNVKLIYTIFALGLVSLIYGQILHRARN